MDVAMTALAMTAVHALLPYIRNVGDAATKRMGERLFDTLSQHLSRHPDIKGGLEQLQREPDSAQSQSATASQLESAFANDPGFAQSVRQVLIAAGTAQININAGNQSNVVGQVFGNADFSQHGQSK